MGCGGSFLLGLSIYLSLVLNECCGTTTCGRYGRPSSHHFPYPHAHSHPDPYAHSNPDAPVRPAHPPPPDPTSTAPTGPTPAVLLAAGDIAKCNFQATPGSIPNVPTTNPAFRTGSAIATQAAKTNGTIFTLGDNSNDTGSAQDYADCFGPMWGHLTGQSDFYPAMGNHDQIADGSGGPYFAYFGENAHQSQGGKYSVEVGAWHVVVLNTDGAIGGSFSSPTASQVDWLKRDLDAHPNRCALAIFHTPYFTSGQWPGSASLLNFWNVLYDHGVEVILNGHNHNYERFAPQNPQGTPDPMGIREFVVGVGGASLDQFMNPTPIAEEYKDWSHYGFLKLTLWEDRYEAVFLDTSNHVIDQAAGTCH